jgi:hypothetical protein
MWSLDRGLCLHREQFLDRRLDGRDLSLLADLLFRAFKLPDSSVPAGATLYRVEMYVWSFANGDGPILREGLAGRQAEAGWQTCQIGLPAPDLLATSTGWREAREPFRIDRLPQVFGRGLTDGLPFLLRVSLVRRKRHAGGKLLGGASFSFCGTWDDDHLLLKALWGDTSEPQYDAIYALAPWREEAELLEAFDEYRSRGTIRPEVAKHFLPRGAEWLTRIVWLVVARPGERRWPAFMRRVALFLGLTLFSAGVGLYLVFPGAMILGFALALLFGLCLACVVGSRALMIRRFYREMAKQDRSLAENPVKLTRVEAETSDVALEKHTRDLEALGCTYALDVRSEPDLGIKSRQRVFLLPDSTGYFAVLALVESPGMRCFPSQCTFLVHTRFADGDRLFSLNQGAGYRKPLQDAVIGRLFDDCRDVGSMLSCHQRTVERLCAEGRTPTRMEMDADELLDYLNQQEQRFRENLARSRSSTWRAAFRQEFELLHPSWRE